MPKEHGHFKLEDMIRGWFIGDFEPSVLRTNDFEVAVQSYPAGSKEENHVHKIATEYTVIASGKCKMNGKVFSNGDIIVIEPGNPNIFEAVTEVVTVVVKIPSVSNDKYLV